MIKITQIFILVIILVIAGYDIVAFTKGGTEGTISHVLLVWSYNYPIFTLLIGIVIGHLFWRIRDTKDTKRLGKK